MVIIATILFLTPVFSLYEAGKSTYWTFAGDGYWTRVILLFELDLPSLLLLALITFGYLIRISNNETTKNQTIIGYFIAILFIIRLVFHFVLSEQFVYFYIRNYFGPSIYKNIHPYKIRDNDKNLTSQLKLLFPKKIEQILVLAYARETKKILNANSIDNGELATSKRWFIWQDMDDLFEKNDNRFVWHTIHNIEYTIINTYEKQKKFNYYHKHNFDRDKNINK